MSSSPITPDELIEQSVTSIPDIVIDCVNEMLVNKWNKSSNEATIHQDELVEMILSKAGDDLTKHELFENNMLDFEPLYDRAGYKVSYWKPAYNESGHAYFKFRLKGKNNVRV